MNKIREIEQIFEEYKELVNADFYFCEEEIEESRTAFIDDLEAGHKEYYIKFLRDCIEDIKPAGVHGVYDFGLLREYIGLIEKIERV